VVVPKNFIKSLSGVTFFFLWISLPIASYLFSSHIEAIYKKDSVGITVAICVAIIFGLLLVSLKLFIAHDEVKQLVEKNKGLSGLVNTSIAALSDDVLNTGPTKKYLNSLRNLHKHAANNYGREERFEILGHAVTQVKDIFDVNTSGFAVPIVMAPALYGILAKDAESITIVEPEAPLAELRNLYDQNFLDFLDAISRTKKIKSKAYFLSSDFRDSGKATSIKQKSSVLTDAGFTIGMADRGVKLGVGSEKDKKWLSYSHVIFQSDGVLLACSVLPLFTQSKNKEVGKYEENNPDSQADATLMFSQSETLYMVISYVDLKKSINTEYLSNFLSQFDANNIKRNFLNIIE